MGIERGDANIHYGQQHKDRFLGPKLTNDPVSKRTPDLDRIITGRKSPIPRTGTIRGSELKRKGGAGK